MRLATALHTREEGFGLVEVMVSILIAAILMGIAVPTYFGARRSAYVKEARTTAGAYATAIAGFQLASYGRAPDPPGTGNWLDPKVGPTVTDANGKVQRFMKAHVPEGITSGRVAVMSGTPGAIPAPAKSAIFYERPAMGAYGAYVIWVRADEGQGVETVCAYYNKVDPVDEVPQC